MIIHTVFIKFKPGAENSIDTAIFRLNELQGTIPGLRSMKAGRNFSERNQGFQLCLVSTFRSRQDLADYIIHPAHKAVVTECITEQKEDILVGDIEVDGD